MAELTNPDGTPVDAAEVVVNQEFARAMAADSAEDAHAAPPKRRVPAAPTAPAKRRGRPPKAERARVDAAPAHAAPGAALSDEDRAQGVKGLVQIGAGLCLVGHRVTGSDGFKADAIVLVSAADDLADACVLTAKADARFASLLDRVCAVGPYGALVSTVMGVGLQLARNHRPNAPFPGTLPPDEIIRRSDAAAGVADGLAAAA